MRFFRCKSCLTMSLRLARYLAHSSVGLSTGWCAALCFLPRHPCRCLLSWGVRMRVDNKKSHLTQNPCRNPDSMGRDTGLNGLQILLPTATGWIISNFQSLSRMTMAIHTPINIPNKNTASMVMSDCLDSLGNALVYPYKCPSACTRRALLEYA